MLPKFLQRRLAVLKAGDIPIKARLKRRWRLLQIEPAIVCNLKCIMCPWREIAKNSKNNGLMAPEVWNAIRPCLSELSSNRRHGAINGTLGGGSDKFQAV
jgi:hypothetical protein